jgi:outer membrane protein insertion porin family
MWKGFSKVFQEFSPIPLQFRFGVVVVLFLLSSASTVLRAQSEHQQIQQYKILGISVEGNKSADAAAIIANSGLRVGDSISVPGEQARTAVTRLWALRIFSDIQIEAEKIVGDGMYVLIKVQEYPRLEKVVVKGEDDLSEEDVMKKVDLVKGQIVTPQEVNEIIKALKKKYEEDGYLRAEITPETVVDLDSSADGRVILKLNIDEGKEVTISHIIFYGNKSFSSDDLRGEMSDTHEHVWWKFWRSSKFDKKKYADDKKNIIDFYRKNGYRDAEILTDSISYDPDKEHMTIRIYLNEGTKYWIRHITWDGNTVFTTAELNDRLGIHPGDVYNYQKFDENLRANEDQTDVASLYLDNGYLTVSLDPEEHRIPPDSMDIVIHVLEHNQFRVGRVDIRGNTKTQERVIRRELYSRPGDYFSRSNIIRSIRQLQQLQYFDPEKIKPDTRFENDSTVDVIYNVEEKSNDTFNMSVGYSGAFGFTGGLGLTFNNFALSDPLEGGGGQILNFDWQFGEGSTYQTFSVSFREPWMFDTPTSFGASVFDTKENYVYYVQLTGGTVSVGRRFKWPDDYFSGNWTFEIQKIDNLVASDIYGPVGSTSQFSVTQVISRNSIDNPLFPTRGSNVALSTELSGPPFLPGNAEYTKHILSVDWYIPIFNSTKLALYLGSEYGEIFRFRKDSYIPYTDEFYMGGTGLTYVNTIPLRGYDDRGVGPVNTLNQVLPGTVMEKHTAELRYNVSLDPIPIYILGFAEGGNVWDNIEDTQLFDLDRSAGLGARVLINPIGLIGFDYGYGFDDANHDGKPDGWHFHFQFGKGF